MINRHCKVFIFEIEGEFRVTRVKWSDFSPTELLICRDSSINKSFSNEELAIAYKNAVISADSNY